MTKAHSDLVRRTELTPSSVARPDNFTPFPGDYASESDKPSANVNAITVETPGQIKQHLLSTAENDRQREKILADWKDHHLDAQIKRLRKGAIKNLNSLKGGRLQPSDVAPITSVIQWAKEQCELAIRHDGYVYIMKISYDSIGEPKGKEPTNKASGVTKHCIPIAVMEDGRGRKLKPHQIGRIGDVPLPGQLIQVGWTREGHVHSDFTAYLQETVATAEVRSYFDPSQAQRCVNLNFTAVTRPGQEKSYHSLASLIIVPLVPFGQENGNLVYTQRGIGDLIGLPHQAGNVVDELIEDVERREREERNRAMREAEAAKPRIDQFFQSSSHSNHSAQSRESDMTSATRHDVSATHEDVPSVARQAGTSNQSGPPSSTNTNYVTQTSDNDSQSSGSSSSPQSSGTPHRDLSDDEDEDDFDKDSEDVTNLHRLLTYKEEKGEEIEEEDGVFYVRSDDIAGSFYTSNFHTWWKYHVGMIKSTRGYRDLNASELAVLRSEGIDIHDENYRRRVELASNGRTVQLVKKKFNETDGRRKRKRRRRKDRT